MEHLIYCMRDISIYCAELKELGDYLIVVVSTDEFNWNGKTEKMLFQL